MIPPQAPRREIDALVFQKFFASTSEIQQKKNMTSFLASAKFHSIYSLFLKKPTGYQVLNIHPFIYNRKQFWRVFWCLCVCVCVCVCVCACACVCVCVCVCFSFIILFYQDMTGAHRSAICIIKIYRKQSLSAYNSARYNEATCI